MLGPLFGLLVGIWDDRMAGDKGGAAAKPGCETEVVHINGFVGFGVFVGQS